MDKIKILTIDEFNEIVAETGFDFDLLNKDYFLTIALYLIKDVKGLFFKGGTAIQKTMLDYSRLSEDIDFTVTENLEHITREIINKIQTITLFHNTTKDKDVEGFLRLIVHYKSFSGKDDTIFLDLNKKAKIILEPEYIEINHFYEKSIPKFSFSLLNKKELIAEKMAATIGRNKPRDHFDLYKIVKKGLPIDLDLVKEKCKSSGDEFNIIKMFNRAKKLKNRWDQDTLPLIKDQVGFDEVMKTLAKYFNLKQKKRK